MGQFLFLYPIREYFDAAANIFCPRPYEYTRKMNQLNIHISKMYRTNNINVNWVFFDKDDRTMEPDTSQAHDSIEIESRDGVLGSGVSFRRHVDEEVYAQPRYVLDQLPPHDKLVVGGFHQWDCVDKMARASHERGVKTMVDEQTTELFLARKLPRLDPDDPIRRAGYDARKGKPWFGNN